MLTPETEKWELACIEERQAMKELGVYKLVKKEIGTKPIGTRWVFDVKKDIFGSIVKYKAGFVVKGFTQRYGFDFWKFSHR